MTNSSQVGLDGVEEVLRAVLQRLPIVERAEVQGGLDLNGVTTSRDEGGNPRGCIASHRRGPVAKRS